MTDYFRCFSAGNENEVLCVKRSGPPPAGRKRARQEHICGDIFAYFQSLPANASYPLKTFRDRKTLAVHLMSFFASGV